MKKFAIAVLWILMFSFATLLNYTERADRDHIVAWARMKEYSIQGEIIRDDDGYKATITDKSGKPSEWRFRFSGVWRQFDCEKISP